MAKTVRWLTFVLVFGLFFTGCQEKVKEPEVSPTMTPTAVAKDQIKLPEPQKAGKVSLEETIQKRRSRRDFTDKPLNLAQISQILWAAQGITEEATGFRAAPSAGALYPLEVYVVAKEKGIEGLEAGVYRFIPEGHLLQVHQKRDMHQDFVAACLNQEACDLAPVSLVITAVYERTTEKYGERGRRYVEIEVGHVGQNVYLQTEALGLGTCAIGAYNDEKIARILNLPKEHEPLYIMPLGYPK